MNYHDEEDAARECAHHEVSFLIPLMGVVFNLIIYCRLSNYSRFESSFSETSLTDILSENPSLRIT